MDWVKDHSPWREVAVVILIGCALISAVLWATWPSPSGSRTAATAPVVASATP